MIDHWDNSIDQAESFTYDLTGSRTKLQRDVDGDSVVDEVITYSYDANDRLVDEILDDLTPANADTTTTYTYDHTQQTEKTVTAGAITVSKQTFGYNLQGRMSSVVNDTFDGSGDLTARQRTRYEYDSKSYRVKLVNESDVVTNGVAADNWTTDSTVEFLADHHNHTGYTQTIRETKTNADGTTKTVDYTFGHDEIAQRVVERDATPAKNITSDETHVFGHDGHGSVRVLYDLSSTVAEVVQAFTFAAYGQMIAVHDGNGAFLPGGEAAALTSLGYSGEHFDTKAQQQYLRARFYNPVNGRFNRLDPFTGNMQDPQSLHKYAYVHGDPVQGIDPSGMISLGSVNMANVISTIQRGMSAAANYAALNYARVTLYASRFIYQAVLRAQFNLSLAAMGFTTTWSIFGPAAASVLVEQELKDILTAARSLINGTDDHDDPLTGLGYLVYSFVIVAQVLPGETETLLGGVADFPRYSNAVCNAGYRQITQSTCAIHSAAMALDSAGIQPSPQGHKAFFDAIKSKLGLGMAPEETVKLLKAGGAVNARVNPLTAPASGGGLTAAQVQDVVDQASETTPILIGAHRRPSPSGIGTESHEVVILGNAPNGKVRVFDPNTGQIHEPPFEEFHKTVSDSSGYITLQ